jgi:hypothetical protein
VRRTELCLDAMVYVCVWVVGAGCMDAWVGGWWVGNFRCVCVFVRIVCVKCVCACCVCVCVRMGGWVVRACVCVCVCVCTGWETH